MITDIVDVNELESVSEQLDNLSDQLSDTVNSLNSILIQARDYDGINVSAAGNTLRNNLRSISSDMKNVSRNISGYTGGIKILDFDDFSIDFDLFSLEDIFSGGVDFVTSTVDAITKPIENIASNIGNITSGMFESITAPIVGVTGLHNIFSDKNDGNNIVTNSVAMPVSEYVNSNPKTMNTRNLSGEITERTVYKSPAVRYPDLGQLKASGNIVISPGDSNSNLDLSMYSNNTASGFQVTTGNLKYEISQKDYDMICAVVAAESDGTYNDALAVTTTILNRCETSNWVNSYSRDPIQQITAPGQFAVYESGSYELRLNGNYNDQVSKAVSDCLDGIRNHEYLYYRSNGSEWYSENMITETGNRYGYK